MQRGGRGFRNHSHRQKKNPKDTNATTLLEDEHPILQAFRGYSNELDDKHDRHERIVKLSRDITIESKRIIFLLHTIDGRKNNKEKILDEAKHRLQKVIDVNFQAVAKELSGVDPYQYRWAYSPGLQEFIESYSFMEFMQGEEATLTDWKALQEQMSYVEDVKQNDEDKEKNINADEKTHHDDKAMVPTSDIVPLKKYNFTVDPTEYILGLSDLTGELMRRCINSLGSGETQTCVETCKALQQFYTGYVSLNVYRCRELSRKIYTMHQSVLKTENVCYNVKVRGGEAAKWGAVNAYDNKPSDDGDEGYF